MRIKSNGKMSSWDKRKLHEHIKKEFEEVMHVYNIDYIFITK